MILFCGIPTEAPLALAIRAAERKRLPIVIFDQRRSRDIALQLSTLGQHFGGSLRVQGVIHKLSSFTGVYTRLMDWRQMPDADEHSRLVFEGLSSWLEVARCRVLNRAAAMATNCSKPYQAQLIAKQGFLIPPTLVTNEAEEVERFRKLWPRLIYKSTSSTRSIVQELPAGAALNRLRNLPTQFQAFIPGVNLRVHVIGCRVFATEICTEATDYRYAGRTNTPLAMKPVRLPAALREKCLALSRALELPFCGIDLKRTPDNEYYCFEVNPSPAYSYYQEQTRQPIAAAVAAYLAGR